MDGLCAGHLRGIGPVLADTPAALAHGGGPVSKSLRLTSSISEAGEPPVLIYSASSTNISSASRV